MKLFVAVACLGWTLTHLPAFAAPQLPTDLPAAHQVAALIEQDPSVAQARAALDATGHTAAMTRMSPYEWTAKVHGQRRRYDSAGSSNEWGMQLERPIRIGGKAGIDAELAQTLVRQAQARLGEARHEASRALLDGWLDWLTAVRARELLAEQLAFAQANNKAVDTRRKAGDASMLEVNVAKADVTEVQRQLSSAKAQEDRTAVRLRVRFPALTLDVTPLSTPVEPEGSEAQWLAKVVEASESLQVAQQEVKHAELVASRASAERTADPTLGVFTASEAFRNERIVGVSISIPLGGTYRREKAAEALQQVAVARAALDAERRVLEVRVAEAYAEAVSGVQRWRQSEEAVAAARESARLTQRAYALGEADLQTLLLVRRQSHDALAAASLERVAALRARYRLLLDAEMLWTSPGHNGSDTPR
jgi:outer membrane protein TolC